ncbi:hypothetical protein SAMN05216288_2856 [Pseudomonas punonensis]|uniref:Uncharacterized protein n=1 Tax=Phytopseudomonas punonensis TaxID=1220495 RepID=A0A1M7FFN1_9GAMM|nr:hypothetical protein SAMN05216288_2856 [Pseudomonas punonensis]
MPDHSRLVQKSLSMIYRIILLQGCHRAPCMQHIMLIWRRLSAVPFDHLQVLKGAAVYRGGGTWDTRWAVAITPHNH